MLKDMTAINYNHNHPEDSWVQHKPLRNYEGDHVWSPPAGAHHQQRKQNEALSPC